jgi:hypothetical protein
MKINTGAIEGFETMTAEQKVEALLGLDMDPTKSGFRTQEEFDRIMTENKQKKDEIRKLKENVGANTELEKRLAELEEKNKELDRLSRMASLKASFTELGYSKELAEEAAKASVENDTAKVLEIQSKFLVERDKKIREDAMKKMRRPGGGGDDGDKNELVDIAKSIGKSQAEAAKAASDALSNYLI